MAQALERGTVNTTSHRPRIVFSSARDYGPSTGRLSIESLGRIPRDRRKMGPFTRILDETRGHWRQAFVGKKGRIASGGRCGYFYSSLGRRTCDVSFLSSLFLWALPLAAVPVVIHLLHRRRRQVVRWGAMQLLLESVPHKRRIWHINDLLLMLLRVLAVAAVVLAFARPQAPLRPAVGQDAGPRRHFRHRCLAVHRPSAGGRPRFRPDPSDGPRSARSS